MALPIASGAASAGSAFIQSARTEGSTIDRLLELALKVFIVLLLVGTVIVLYLVIDNWEWLTTFFTTGIIGWLNPFDSSKGDISPTDAVDGVGSTLPFPLNLLF